VTKIEHAKLSNASIQACITLETASEEQVKSQW
jgi:hypothetical protein